MTNDTFVTDNFDNDVEAITDEIADVVTHDQYEGNVEYDTYRENEESPVDVEIVIRGHWADLAPVTAVVQMSSCFTSCVFAQSDDGSGRVILGLEYHPDVEGLFHTGNY